MKINKEKLYWFVILPLFMMVMAVANTQKAELLEKQKEIPPCCCEKIET